MEQISAIVCVRNEEKNIPRLIDSLKDCSEIIIADGGSTDSTVSMAKNLGAKVIIRNDEYDKATQIDITEFYLKFGYFPSFTVGDKITNMGKFRNAILKEAKNDWIFYPDADEIVVWDLPRLQIIMESYDQIECRLIQDRKNYKYNNIVKLFKKSKAQWVGRNHEVITYSKNILVDPSVMKINHYSKKNKNYSCITNLEYAVIKEKDSRSMFYLGREYYYEKQYDKSVKILDDCIKNSVTLNEIAESYYQKGLTLWDKYRGILTPEAHEGRNSARTAILHAIEINANMKKAFNLMADMIRPQMKSKWLEFSKLADNQEVIFP